MVHNPVQAVLSAVPLTVPDIENWDYIGERRNRSRRNQTQCLLSD
jgi:hypothetical protein